MLPVHEYTNAFRAGGGLAYANTGHTWLGASLGNEWAGTLYLNGTSVLARARKTEAVGNLYAPAFLKVLLVGD